VGGRERAPSLLVQTDPNWRFQHANVQFNASTPQLAISWEPRFQDHRVFIRDSSIRLMGGTYSLLTPSDESPGGFSRGNDTLFKKSLLETVGHASWTDEAGAFRLRDVDPV
jgi:hypothetical protein